MRKMICILLVFSVLFAGCAGHSTSETARIQAEWDLMTQETNELLPTLEDWQERHSQFLAGLTNEQLEAYDKYCSTPSENEAASIITLRKLQDVLSEDESQTLRVLA